MKRTTTKKIANKSIFNKKTTTIMKKRKILTKIMLNRSIRIMQGILNRNLKMWISMKINSSIRKSIMSRKNMMRNTRRWTMRNCRF